MRILFVTGEYPPMQGGVGDYTWALGTALSALGVDVHVLTNREAGPSYLMPAGVSNVYAEVDKWGWGMMRQASRWAREIQPDILHIQYQSAAYQLHGAVNLLPRFLRRARWPRHVAVTFHDLRVPYLFPKAGPLRWKMNLEMARHSDLIVVTNTEDRARLQAYSDLAGKQAEIPIGANIQPEPPANFDRTAQRARWGVEPDALLLCYFGFLNASKGGEDLIGALHRLAVEGFPVHLLMLGGQVGASDPTNFAYLQQVKQRIVDLELEDRVHWSGFIPAGEVSANFLAADIAALPYREGVSFRRGSLMAALVHGLPIVSTQPAVDIPEMVQGENIWLVPADSPDALAQAIGKLWQSPEQRRILSQGARQLAGRFTWDAIARRHVEVYRALA